MYVKMVRYLMSLAEIEKPDECAVDKNDDIPALTKFYGYSLENVGNILVIDRF